MTEINTSKKTISKQPGKEKLWQAALYVRLSREDGDREESDSISNQKVLLQRFVDFESDIMVYDTYVDDGWTGTNFDRPDFMRMINDINEKKVNCVIVKDLSRFGRNYINSGRYLEEIFPFMNIRFISLNDNLDSVKNPQTMNNIMVPFKNLINDEYCRDISNKVRSSLDIKRKQGKHIGSFACYGYKKDPDDHNHLIIDEEAADIVRDIFRWYISGMSILSITRKLNEMRIPNPSNYKKKQGLRYRNRSLKNSDGRWLDSAVRRMLGNRMYVGDLVQGVIKVKSYKVQVAQRQEPEEWIIVENTHEPIVSREDYEVVQELLKRKTRKAPGKKEVYLLSGYVRCGDCGRSMYRKHNRHTYGEYSYYNCTTYRKIDKTACTKHSIRVDELEKRVLEAIQLQIAVAVNVEKAINVINASGKANKETGRLRKMIEQAEHDVERADMMMLDLYPDLKAGIIEKDVYMKLKERYEGQKASALAKVQELQEKIEKVESGQDSTSLFLERFVKYKNIDKLTREIIVGLIDMIYIYEGNKIKIVFKYEDPFKDAKEYIENNKELLDPALAESLLGA